MDTSKLHIAMLSSPGMGHIIPVIVLANRLATNFDCKVTVLVVTAAGSPPECHLLNLPTSQDSVEVHQLPAVDISHLVNPTTKVVTQLCLIVREALPLIRSAIAAMHHRPVAIIADLFCTEVARIADEFNMAKYVYLPTTAWFAALTLYCPVLDKEIAGQYVDKVEPLKIPGCKSVRPEDVIDPMLDRNDQQYDEYVKMGHGLGLFDGMLVNSWEDLEPTTLRAFKENEMLRAILKSPVYPIGPLTRPVGPARPKSGTMGWLDKQPSESVLFVSFGSGGMLSAEQMNELAHGLEMSQQRFIWVVRPPTRGRADDAFFQMKNGLGDTQNYLPEGFVDRTRETGFLIPMWAEQLEILSHPSVGAFLSHCGWNSTLESITHGVPTIAWPLYAEQRLNATLLAEELGIAVRPKVLPTKKVVRREEIESMVNKLMQHEEGKAMKDKAKHLKLRAAKALSEGGSSDKALCEVIESVQKFAKRASFNGTE